MKILDFEKKGNVIRLYLGKQETNNYWGDDWDDAPYEHNSGIVNPKYVTNVIDLYIDYDYSVVEPADDFTYSGNTPFSKEDFKNRKCPILVLGEYKWDFLYSIESLNKNNITIYMNDPIKEIIKKLEAKNCLIKEVYKDWKE